MGLYKFWNHSVFVAILVHFGIIEEPESMQDEVAYQNMLAKLEARSFEVGLSIGLVSLLILEAFHFLFVIGLNAWFQ